MSVTPSFLTYVIDQLGEVGSVAARRMFGGIGLYSGKLFFGVIDDDVVFLRVDEATRPAYIERGMTALRPVKSKPDMAMEAYYQLPNEVLDDTDELPNWVRQAIAVAAAAPIKKKTKPRKHTKSSTKPKAKPAATPKLKSKRRTTTTDRRA